MKSSKILLAMLFAMVSLTLSGIANACDACNMRHGTMHHHCKIIKGHWHNGHWVPAHKVCRVY